MHRVWRPPVLPLIPCVQQPQLFLLVSEKGLKLQKQSNTGMQTHHVMDHLAQVPELLWRSPRNSPHLAEGGKTEVDCTRMQWPLLPARVFPLRVCHETEGVHDVAVR